MTTPSQYHLSASSIAAFKACPQRFRLGYREGLRVDEDTEAQRMGTHWHALHEVYQQAWQRWTPVSGDTCDRGGRTREDAALEVAVEHLNAAYENMPATKTPEEWDIERMKLWMSFVGYLWYWSDDPLTPLDQELAFDLPLHEPRTGLPLPVSEVIRVGHIDEIVEWRGRVVNVERKSTSKSVEDGSDYWDKAQKDTQVSMYALAVRDLANSGQLPDAVTEHVGNTVYDVWHKPTITPKKLSQKDTAAFLETGVYCDQEFEVEFGDDWATIDGVAAEVEVGKSGKPAIRETPAMYGARLLEDIQERPTFYFNRREIARTDADLDRFRRELYNIYQAQKMYSKNDCWFENEQQCRATFKCQYIPVCYGPGADAVCDGETTPDGFRRIYTDITINQEDINPDE